MTHDPTRSPFHGVRDQYAPRATVDTNDRLWFARHRIPAGTEAEVCPRCGQPVYPLETAPAGVGVSGYDNAPVPYDATVIAVDCATDVAGIAPSATAIGSGIRHTMLCDLPRPLPPTPPADAVRGRRTP